MFFERDVPYYASNRDSLQVPGFSLRLYGSWDEIQSGAVAELRDADAAIITSYCPDGVAACGTVLDSGARVKAFYDLDTPVTLSRLGEGEQVEYMPPEGLGDFDVVLSYTGGEALTALREKLGARRVAPLYGSVDPEVHRPAAPQPAFYCSSRLTLNVTRRAMAAMGYCPSGRLFEAAACGVPVISDHWEGLDRFYTPGSEILVCRQTADVLEALGLSESELAKIAGAARERTLAEHTASNRAGELERILEGGVTATRA